MKESMTMLSLITSVSLATFALVASLVVTHVDMVKGTFDILIRGDHPIVEEGEGAYKSDDASKDELVWIPFFIKGE